MHPIILRTFGGLSMNYYVRQLIFGLIFPIFIILMLSQSAEPITVSTLLMLSINTFLYPYSRFVYESIVDFVLGENVFIVNAIFMLAIKFVSMLLCWSFAIFIAPFGLAYLYYRHSKEES